MSDEAAPGAIGVIQDERFEAHHAVGSHPERPERLAAARAGLEAGLPTGFRRAIPLAWPSDESLGRVHDLAYVRSLRHLTGFGHLDPDTFYSPGTRDAAFGAAGAALAATEYVMADTARQAIALVRPPGHHALSDAAMGFCVLNNVAVAAAEALARGATRVAIVDWDVHHGNGTQAIFERDRRVLFVSLHQYPHYPGTGAPSEVGAADGRGYSVNVALPAGAGPEEYGHAFRAVVLPILAEFGPEVVLVSAGFDAHARDPLAGMELDAPSYGALTSALLEAGHRRLAFFLEGGYDLSALESSMREVARALHGVHTELPVSAPSAAGRSAVERTIRALQPYWACLSSARLDRHRAK